MGNTQVISVCHSSYEAVFLFFCERIQFSFSFLVFRSESVDWRALPERHSLPNFDHFRRKCSHRFNFSLCELSSLLTDVYRCLDLANLANICWSWVLHSVQKIVTPCVRWGGLLRLTIYDTRGICVLRCRKKSRGGVYASGCKKSCLWARMYLNIVTHKKFHS